VDQRDLDGRVPPYSKEAEGAVLGGILLNNEALVIVEGILSQSDFYMEPSRRIYAAMRNLADDKTPIDHITLAEQLKKNGDYEKIGGAATLSRLTDLVVTTANIDHYAGIIREKSAIRGVVHASQEAAAHGFSSEDPETLNASVLSIVEASHALARTRMPMSMFELGDGVLEMYRKVAGGYRGIPLPWPTLDNMTAGMWPKTVTMFVARPGVGKTFVAVIAARHAWQQGCRTLIVSPEMSKEEIAERFFVVEADVSYLDVMRGQLSDFSLPKLEDTIERSRTKENLWIMDSNDDLSLRGIEAAVRACRPHLVAVDSIYDLKISGDRRERALAALEWMKRGAKALDFACVGFAQQNRAAELSEKKGGGARLGTIALADEIGQDVHAVYALEQSKDDKADKVLRFKTLKLRRGHILREVVRANWDFDGMNYDEIPEKDEGYDDNEPVPF